MAEYESPSIVHVGTVAELTRAFGFGPGSDNAFPHFREHHPDVNAIFTTS